MTRAVKMGQKKIPGKKSPLKGRVLGPVISALPRLRASEQSAEGASFVRVHRASDQCVEDFAWI